MNPIRTELRIPDLWYDFYARFLPGSAFIAALYLLLNAPIESPTWTELLLLAFAGYFSGLMVQPISSRVTGFLHLGIAKLHKKDKNYVNQVASKLKPNEKAILDKMHGETTCFVQLAMLTGILVYVTNFLPLPKCFAFHKVSLLWFILSGVFLIFAAEISDRRIRRAEKHKNIYGIIV